MAMVSMTSRPQTAAKVLVCTSSMRKTTAEQTGATKSSIAATWRAPAAQQLISTAMAAWTWCVSVHPPLISNGTKTWGTKAADQRNGHLDTDALCGVYDLLLPGFGRGNVSDFSFAM